MQDLPISRQVFLFSYCYKNGAFPRVTDPLSDQERRNTPIPCRTMAGYLALRGFLLGAASLLSTRVLRREVMSADCRVSNLTPRITCRSHFQEGM